LLPILYVVSGLWGGAEVTLGISLASGEAGVGTAVHEWIPPLLLGFVFLIPIYLMSVRYTSVVGRVSVRYVTLGPWSPLFWLVVVVLGMVIPLAAVINSFAAGMETTPAALLYAAILSGLIGDVAMRYLILKGGMYSPLIPSSASSV
jgi:formate-dependent nitrite reductase membrane component NrfD